MKRLPFQRNVVRLAVISLIGLGSVAFAVSNSNASKQAMPQALRWIEAGAGGVLPAENYYENAHGRLGVLNATGPVEMKDHPFFEPLGMNPRGCVTCHQPANAMSVSVEA